LSKKFGAFAGGVLAIVLVAPCAHAYRPFDGTDADVSSLGELELEIGPLGYLRASHDSALVFASTVVNYGFLPRWEVVAEGQGVAGFDGTLPPRFTDGSLFVKHVLRSGVLQGKTGISLAVELGVLFPNNDEPFAENTGLHLSLITSYAWRELAAHFNVWLERSSDGRPDAFASLILEFHPGAAIRPVTEIFFDRHGDVDEPSALVGFIWRASDHISLDAATRLAWDDGAPLYEIRAGLTIGVPFIRERR
jgi:hypothetical protein